MTSPQSPIFRGTIGLDITATDTDHQIFAVHETIPVQASGEATLLYPQWETASHAPTISVAEMAGLVIHIDGRRTEWRRDPVDMHAFHLDIPKGARVITVDFQYLPPQSSALLRPDMVDVQWQHMLVYPSGWPSSDIPVEARLQIAPGLKTFTALDLAHEDGGALAFAPTTLAALVDSPVYAARYWRQFDLAPGAAKPVRLDVIADQPGDLAVPPEALANLRSMVTQAGLLFGSGPYRHYDAIVSLSDALSPGGGTEHLEEGENNMPAQYFTDAVHQLGNDDLIAHEYVHAWNGRFRQPGDLWSTGYNTPVGGSLLWVYEGQTEFWGRVLAARAGMRSLQDSLDRLALDAALVANRSGRSWKSLADSNNDAVYMAGHQVRWRDWQRREDYYPEGVLLWLDVDARLRELSGGRQSLDDVARRFFATAGVGQAVSTYRFDDVCAALNAVAPGDWATFLNRHLDSHDDRDALAGLARAGWRLTFSETPTETYRQDEAEAGVANFDYSIGLQVRPDGVARSIVWDSPAFRAGLAPGVRIVLVNGAGYSPAALEAAVRATASHALTLTFENAGRTRSAVVGYTGGLRYPRLERIPKTVDRLTALLTGAR